MFLLFLLRCAAPALVRVCVFVWGLLQTPLLFGQTAKIVARGEFFLLFYFFFTPISPVFEKGREGYVFYGVLLGGLGMGWGNYGIGGGIEGLRCVM